MPSLNGILRFVVAVLGLFAFAFLLGGMLSYKRISFKEMQVTDPLQMRATAQDVVLWRDYGEGWGKIAFERGLSISSAYGDKVELYNMFYNNPDMQVCFGNYDDQSKLIPHGTTGCRSTYIEHKVTCDPTAPNAVTRSKTEWNYDAYISDKKKNQRQLEVDGRQSNGGEMGVYLATSFVSLLVGLSVFWWSNDQERKSVHVSSLLLMIIAISLPYIFFYHTRDNEFINWVECKDMTDLEYYGSEAGATCLTNTNDKAEWDNENIYLDRMAVEKTKLSCSSFSSLAARGQCTNDCTWVSTAVSGTEESDTQQKVAALTAETCRPATMVGREAFPCTAQQKKFWERAGLAWKGSTRVRLSSAVRSSDGNDFASEKVKFTDYKLAAEDCMKKKDTKCVTDPLSAISGCTTPTDNKPLCDESESLGADFFYGPKVALTKAISGSTVFDASSTYKNKLETYGSCSDDDLKYLELKLGLAKFARAAVPAVCLSDQAGEQRSKYMDQFLARAAIGQTGIIFMMLETAVIFVLLLLEVWTARKEQKLDSVSPEA